MARCIKFFNVVFALSLLGSADAAEAVSWSGDIVQQLKTASTDHKPVLILIRNPQDVGSIDARYWFNDDEKQFAAILAGFHCVMLWSGSPALKEFPAAPQSGLFFLTPKAEPIAVEDVPHLRAGLKPLLESVLAAPVPIKIEAEAPKLKRREAEYQRQWKTLPDDLKAQLKELAFSIKPAASDKKIAAKAKALVNTILARDMTRDAVLRSAGILGHAILELDLADERLKLAEKIKKEAPHGRVAADAFLDLAENSFSRGEVGDAQRYLRQAEKASENGESPTFYKAACAMRALLDGKSGPAQSRWARREVLDTVVLVPDLPSFLHAIARWDEDTFFPVLFEDDLYTPKFIAAFKPGTVVRHKAELKTALDADHVSGAIAASWQSKDNENADPSWFPRAPLMPPLHGSFDAHARGIVVTDFSSGELAGAAALAAGRFQPLVVISGPKNGDAVVKSNGQLSKDLAWDFSKKITQAMRNWGALDETRGWSYITLAGNYPFRYTGDADGYGYGSTYALDDLVGRDEDGVRHSVVGRLIGDPARSAYQAMCSLFLQPESAFLFNTYGLDPKSIWGVFRMDFSEAAFKERLALTHYKGDGATIEMFRECALPWNRDGLITINSSGGAGDWSVSGGGGTADDFPVGAPCAFHVTHSGSAGDPYNPDTLAGRAVWGGAYFYFGSCAEPFLSAFQPPSYYAPMIAAGVPFAAAYRKRTGQWFSQPWRLMIVGDPQFSLRKEPAKRKAYKPLASDVVLKGEGAPPKISDGPLVEQLRRARWINDTHTSLGLSMSNASAIAEGKTVEIAEPSLAMMLEELVQARALDVALKLWEKAPAEARNNYAARIYARQAAGGMLDKALAAENLPALCLTMEKMLTTYPALNFVERWLGQFSAMAEKQKDDGAYSAWLGARAGDVKAEPYRSAFLKRFTAARLNVLALKEKWNAEDKAEALKTFSDAVKAKQAKDDLLKLFDDYSKCCAAKFPGASQELIHTEILALFPLETDGGKRITELFIALEKRRGVKK